MIEWLLEYGLGIVILVIIVAAIKGTKDVSRGGAPTRPAARPAAEDEQERLRPEDTAFLDGYIFYRYYHDHHLHDREGHDHDTAEDDAWYDDDAWHADDDWGDD